MDTRIVDRRRLLQWIMLASLALPAAALSGCAQTPGGTRPPHFPGGSDRGEKAGGGRGGPGSGGPRGH